MFCLVVGVQDLAAVETDSNLQTTLDSWALTVWPSSFVGALLTQGPWHFQGSGPCGAARAKGSLGKGWNVDSTGASVFLLRSFSFLSSLSFPLRSRGFHPGFSHRRWSPSMVVGSASLQFLPCVPPSSWRVWKFCMWSSCFYTRWEVPSPFLSNSIPLLTVFFWSWVKWSSWDSGRIWNFSFSCWTSLSGCEFSHCSGASLTANTWEDWLHPSGLRESSACVIGLTFSPMPARFCQGQNTFCLASSYFLECAVSLQSL